MCHFIWSQRRFLEDVRPRLEQITQEAAQWRPGAAFRQSGHFEGKQTIQGREGTH